MQGARQTGRIVAVIALAAGFAFPVMAQAATVVATTTLQAAIDQAQPGDTVDLNSGTWNESVAISTDNLTLAGPGTITASTTGPAISITNASTTISGVTVSGAGAYDGIDIANNDSTARTVTLSGVTVGNYLTNGIAGQGAGLILSVLSSTVTGSGGSSSAQYGVYVGSGATADIATSTIKNNECASCTAPSTGAGVLLSGALGTSVISGNTIQTNNFGIVVVGASANVHYNSFSNDTAGIYSDSILDASLNYWGSNYGPAISSNLNNNRFASNGPGDAITGSGDVSYRSWCHGRVACDTTDTTAVDLTSATLSKNSDDTLAVDLVFSKSIMNQYINFTSSTLGVTGVGSATSTVSGSWISGSEWQGNTTDTFSAADLSANVAHLAVYGGEDTYGNQYTGSSSAATIGVDTVGPTITTPGDQTVEATSQRGAAVTYSASATDPSGVPGGVSCTPNTGTTFGFGATTVTCNATDGAGNASSTSFTVTVQDTTAPSLTLGGSSPTIVDYGTTYTDPGATATDQVDGDLTSSIATTVEFGGASTTTVDTSVLGDYTVTYTVTDAHRNTATATRTVSVKDEAAPVITLNGSASVTVMRGTTYTDAGATATDNYDGDLTANIVTTGTSTVDTSTLGDYSIRYNVQDSSGNSAITATRVVHVVPVTYTITPSAGANGAISPNTDTTVTENNDQSFGFYPDAHYHLDDVLVDGSSVGSSTNPYTFTNVTADHTIAASFAPDTYALSYSAGANGSVTGSASQSVVYGGTGTAVTAVPDSGYYFLNWSDGSTTPTRTDSNVSASASLTANFSAKAPVTVTVTGGTFTYDGSAHGAAGSSVSAVDGLSTTATGFSYFDSNGAATTTPTDAGTYSVVASYAGDSTHLSGTSATSTIIITRALTTTLVICRSAHETYDDTAHSDCSASATSTDGLNQSLTVVYGDNVNAGIVSASATYAGDANHAGSTNSGSFIIDKADVTISVTPYAVTYDRSAHSATGSATDINGAALLGLDLSGTAHTAAGDYSDSWTFTDVTGNYNDASGTAADSIAKYALTVGATGTNKEFDGTTAATVSLSATPLRGDTVTPSYTSASFTDASVGTGTQVDVYGISLGGADAANYSANATASTTADIVDTTPPTIATNANIYSQEATSSAGASVAFSLPSASDLNGIASESCAPASGSTFALGSTTVVCTATDLAGNQASSTFAVGVVDTTAPSLALVGSSTVSITVGDHYADQGATATDLVDGDLTSAVATSSTISTTTPGTYAVIYTVSDSHGNTASTTRTVLVSARPVAPAPSGGGGGGPIGLFGTTNGPPVTPVQSSGQVLGAEAYQFAHDFGRGSHGQDVTELQKVLIAEGFLPADDDTGYFGPATKAALIKYQKAHGISPASGYVGPLTRAELDKGQAPTASSGGGTNGNPQTLTTAQVSAILSLLSSFGADQATIHNVSLALGQ